MKQPHNEKGLTESNCQPSKFVPLKAKKKGFENCFSKPNLVGLFIPDLLKGKEPRLTKHIPKVPKMLVFTKNFETRKEYDYGKVHH